MNHILRPAAGILLLSALALLLLLVGQRPAFAQPAAPAAGHGQTDLRINEVMADNRTTLIDPDEPDEAPDWIELYNPGPGDVSLNGLALSDDPEQPAKFPITDGLSIPAGSFVIFYADDDGRQGPFHTNFKLGQTGETVVLYRVADRLTVDTLAFPALGTDESYGRRPDGAQGPGEKLPGPTPGASNASDPPRIADVSTPQSSPAAGVPVTVSAIVTDISQVISVTLVYSATNLGLQSLPMSPGGSNVYSAEIPAFPAGTLVSYYVMAKDIDGEVNRAPVPGREVRYLVGYLAPILLLNEIVYQNDTVPDPDEPAETPDWIELYNPGPATVTLDGLSLSDDKNDPQRYRIPPGLSIMPGGLLVFLADDDAGQGAQHMNFSLKQDGEYVGLYGGEGTVLIDSHDAKQRPMWGAAGRLPDGQTWSALVCPTFNAANLLCDDAVFLGAVRKP